MVETIVAIEQEELEFRAMVLTFEVADANCDLRASVMAAVTEFCQTDKGREIFEANCECFNWADLNSVPNEFFERHGCKLITADPADMTVDWNERLVNDADMD